jgi:2-polyprenyl-6-methoxyphenol hydroxylase-like FAD-dependent oxidoreductase
MAAVEKVLVQGGGIGGLALAIALARRGVEVDVLEGPGRSAVLGVGLNQPVNALDVLEKIGVKQACLDAGISFEALEIWNTDGVKVAAIPPAPGAYLGAPSNNGISRATYYDVLSRAAQDAGARVEVARTARSLVEHPDRVDVEVGAWTGRGAEPDALPDEPIRSYDLVVGFDGVRSRVRTYLFGDRYTPEYTGSGVWRATIPRPDYLTACTFAVAPGNVKVVLMPISSDTMYFGLVTPEPGNPRHAPEDFVELLRERTQVFGGAIAELRDQVSESTHKVYVPIEFVVVREPWYRGRVAIAGDAAHTAPPHMSQGGAMALEDAYVLAESLGENDNLGTALAAWYERRRERVEFVSDMSLALLRGETGVELTDRDKELLAIGLAGANVRVAQEAY